MTTPSVEELERHLDQVLQQYERAMIELGWTMLDVRSRDTLSDLAASAREGTLDAEDFKRAWEGERERAETAEADRDRFRFDAQEALGLQMQAEADRDRLARRVAELEQERDRWKAEATDMAALAKVEGERVAELEAALRDLLDNIGGHEHWDSTMQYGAGCETCIRQREAKQRARAALAGDGGGA